MKYRINELTLNNGLKLYEIGKMVSSLDSSAGHVREVYSPVSGPFLTKWGARFHIWNRIRKIKKTKRWAIKSRKLLEDESSSE